ncbi:SDR family NAD(P)-dependent oxidoreductase [Persicimonas caeni]|uniref:SDR family NAD(P)-dependent oxidoreductase n=1 Tax=Persicimonas caeni TaxID=2292766 RepID=A0A4Y6PN25_PERCE|nr:type I polyketide synthase [Persicimonas caeni]QDG49702.1 SDR family NAD(P)-dependent oxidoreductase [Persicimonas caeni]QED30923.1 SDR family NAD(P)-dependent oxidoreductase [Persicimonas caeni]
MTRKSRSEQIDGRKAIAIVGIGARMPKAQSAPAFWQNILDGVYAIEEVPRDRWNPDLYFDADRDAPDKTYSKIGGWITDFEFGRKKYRLPPLVVRSMDPTQTLCLEAVHEALDDSGYLDKDFDRERCAVILGNAMGGDLRDRTNLRAFYAEIEEAVRMTLLETARGQLDDTKIEQIVDTLEKRFKDELPPITEDAMPGELANVVAGRVAALFNLRGPNFVTDAACASSLAAVEAAIRGLQTGQFDMAVSGGVDRCMGAPTFVKFAKIGALSPDGSRPFDADANGFVMGEGGGAVILKRLEDAERDGDKIYAVIRGVGSSSDGKGKGITAPNPIGQKLSVRRAYEEAGYGPKSVSLFEAHGTSTPVGDPVEANSLLSVLGEDDGPLGADKIGLGSVKSMIGHLKAGAGAASMVKVAFALKHRILPPTLNVETPNPRIEMQGTPLRLQTEAEPWEVRDGMLRRAGVSAFGFGGTNFHVTLEEYDPEGSTGGTFVSHNSNKQTTPTGAGAQAGANTAPAGHASKADNQVHSDGILMFAGDSEADVQSHFESFAADFDSDGLSATRSWRLGLENPSVALPEGAARLAVSYDSEDGLAKKISRIRRAFERGRGWKILANQGIFLSGENADGRLAMLFPGQGAQYVGMLGELRTRFPVIQETFDEADRIMEPILGRKLTSIIFPEGTDLSDDEANELLRQTEVTQPAVLTVNIALLRLFEQFGIQPDLVAGHSLGEYGACMAAGVMSFEDALRTVAARGTQMAKATPMNGDNGLMASISAPIEEVEATLAKVDGYVVCANKNCPKQTIIAGLTDAVQKAVELFEEQGHMVHMLNVSHAFHTKVVAAASEPLREHLDTVDIHTPKVPILTNVTGDFYPTDPNEIRDLLAEQLASPVEYIKLLENMYEAGARVFVEVGPKRAQTTFVDATLRDRDHLSTYTNHPKEGGVASLNNALAQLWAHGVWQRCRRVQGGVTESQPEQAAAPTASHSRDEILSTMLQVLCDKTGYDPDEIEFDFELEADLGIDTVKQAEIMADVREGFSLPKDEDFRLADYPTLDRMADYVEQKLAEAGPAAEPLEPGPAAEPLEPGHLALEREPDALAPKQDALAPNNAPAASHSRDEILSTMLGVLCDKTGYDPDEIEFDFELEADLGIDTVKQAEIMADVREGFSLPKDEDFRLADYPTLDRMADYVEQKLAEAGQPAPSSEAGPAAEPLEPGHLAHSLEAGHLALETDQDGLSPNRTDQDGLPPKQAAAPAASHSRDEILSTMLGVLCDKTGYDPDEIEFDFELEADLGIDTVKQAEIMADVREGFALPKDEDFRLADYPTLARMADYVEQKLAEAPAESQRDVVVEAPRAEAARQTTEGATEHLPASSPTRKYEPVQHDIAAKVSITGTALGLPGLEDMFDEEAVDRLLAGDNFIGDIPMDVRQEMVDKHITRLQKHKDGGGELVAVEDVAEVIKLAGRGGDDFDLEEWGISKRMIEQLDRTSQLAIAAGINALRDAGLPLVPRYRETRSGKKLTIGWQLPEKLGDETGIIFASAFAGEDALIEEVTKRWTQEDYQFNHRFLVRVLGIANSRFAELIGARGPNTKINNACASTTTAMAMAEDWIRAGRCKRVVVISADDASGDTLMDWVGSGFLATGAATTQEKVEDAALPFDKRRHGMIIGMGAVGLVIEEEGLAEARGVEPLADIMATHFVNSAYHPTRLQVDHIAGEVGKLIERAEGDFEFDRSDIADKTVFVSHETYTPARGGSADAEISALRDNFGDKANKIVIANTKGFTGHAMGAGIEDVLAIKTLQKQRVPHIANFKEPDPNLGDLRLSQGGEYDVDYALRLAAGFGSQLALALLRFRARNEDRVFDEVRYNQWLGEVSGFAHPELSVEERTLRLVEGQPEDNPTPPGGGGGKPVEQPSEAALPALEASPGRSASKAPAASPASDVDSSTFDPRPIVVEAHTAAAYDLIEMQGRLSGKNVVILGGPMLVTNTMRRAAERCGATVHVIEDSANRSPLDTNEDTVCNLLDEEAIAREFDAIGQVDGIINLLGYGRETDDADAVYRAARATYHVARAWQTHLNAQPSGDQLFVSVTGMGGRLGFDRSTTPLPLCGSVCGLTKSLGREWKDAAVRVVDVAREGFYPELGLQILSEAWADAPSLELGLIGGVRYVPVIVDAEALAGHGSTNAYAPTKDSVIAVIGGAKGITAEVAVDLAERFGCKLALVGRSELTHPNPLGIDLDAEKEKAKGRIAARGERVTPVKVKQELKPLRSQITIAQNLERIRKAGAQVDYFSCDVADLDSVEVLFDRIESRFGSVDGVIHAAGVEESKLLADKDVESFDRVFRGKALGGLNLWTALSKRDPEFFIAFSSVAGRFGNEGQVDYSAANEVLNKLVAQINASGAAKALTIDWTAWGEVGMATHGSMATILEARGVEFLPPHIGAPIVGDAMERGLTGEYLVAGELGEMAGEAVLERSALTGEQVLETNEMVFVDRIAEQDADHVVVERVFDPERDYFLNDHVYQGVPVLPGVMGYEFMVETANQLVDGDVLELRDVKFERAVKFHHGEPLRLIATAEVAERAAKHATVDVKLETVREAKTGRTLRKQHFTARVTIGSGQTTRPQPIVLDPTAEFEAGPHKLDIYRRYFHTGCFQVLEEVPHVGEKVVIGYGRKPTGRLTASQNGHVFVTDPMVREMALQTAGLWGMKNNALSYLPLAIGRSMQFGVAQPGEGICIRCRHRDDASEHAIAFDVEILTQDGRLLQVMEKVELIGHSVLAEDEQFGDFELRRITTRRLSFPEAELLVNDLGLDIDDVLADSERGAYERLRSETRRAEWLAARVAAKDLVSCHLRNFFGVRPALADIVIAKDEHGAPYVELRGDAPTQLSGVTLPNISITHSNGVAIAALAGPSRAGKVGVDLELIEQRDDSFAKNYFSATERALELPDVNASGDARSVLLTTLWSVKESVSKALGLGLHLNTGEVSVEGLEARGDTIVADVALSGRAQEAFDALSGTGLEVRAEVDGTFAFASAWLELGGEATQTAPTAEPQAKSSDVPESWVDVAAVAALLKHKGLLERADLGESKVRGEKLSPWKQ